MDVYHKILSRVFESAGGRESADVDLVDIIKSEGYFANIDEIYRRLLDESWVTEKSRRYQVRLTHWGVAEAKRVMADLPDKKTLLGKDAGRIINESKQLVIMLEEFEADPQADKLNVIESQHSEIGAIIKRLAQNL